MIYQAYQVARRRTRSVVRLLEVGHRIARHERNPWRDSFAHRALATALELPLRGLKDYDKQRFAVRAEANGRAVVLKERLVDRLPFADLVGFAVPNAWDRPKVLIAAALSGHHATLLRDTLRGFARDFDPYITDWKDARQVPLEAGDFGLEDDIAHLIGFMEALGPGTHLVATCQAAPPAMVAAAVLAKRNPDCVPASLTLMGGPVDTRVNMAPINKLTMKVPLALFGRNIQTVPKGFPGSGRRVYPGFYQLSGFIVMNPLPHLRKYWSFIKDAVKGEEDSLAEFRTFYDEYFAVLDMSEKFYLETLKRVFFEHHIPTGRMTYEGEPVDFTVLRDMPLLTVEGANDRFCPPGQTAAAHDICPNIPAARRGRHIQQGVGHYGVFSGSLFQTEIYPVIRDFIRAG